MLAQLVHEVEDTHPNRHVEHRDGLVGDDQLRPQGERLREPDPLALAAAELVGEAPTRVACGDQPDRIEHAVELGRALGAGQVASVQLHPAQDPVRDPVRRVHRAVRILEHHRYRGAVGELAPPATQSAERPALEPDLAARRLVDEGEQPGDRALAAAALAHQGDDLAVPDGQVDIVDGVQGLPRHELAHLEVAGQALGAEQRLGHPSCPWRTQRTRLPLTA